MRRTRQTVSLASLSRLPIAVTVTPERDLRHLAEIIRKDGEVPPSMQVTVATAADGKSYAVDGLDVIEACGAAGVRDVPCTVVDVPGKLAALCMHVDRSAGVTVNPCAVVDAISMIREGGMSLKNAAMDRRYRYLREHGISGKLKKAATEYLHKTAMESSHIYDLQAVLRPIVKLDEDMQVEAFRLATKYIGITGSVPDAGTMDRMISGFVKRSGDNMVTIQEIDTGEDPKKPSGEVKAVTAGTEDTGYFYVKTRDSIHLTCKCKQEWYVELKRGVVREIDDSHSGIRVLRGNYADPAFYIPESHVKYLDLDDGSPVFHTELARTRKRPHEQHARGGAVLTSRKRIPGDVIRKINGLLKSAGL